MKRVLHAGKECSCKDSVIKQLAPALRLTTDVQAWIAEQRNLLIEAQLDDETVEGSTERLYQTLGAMEADIKALQENLRRVRLGVVQYQRYSNEIEKDLS